MADVQADALELSANDVRALGAAQGAEVLAHRLDVSKAAEVDALAAATRERFGVCVEFEKLQARDASLRDDVETQILTLEVTAIRNGSRAPQHTDRPVPIEKPPRLTDRLEQLRERAFVRARIQSQDPRPARRGPREVGDPPQQLVEIEGLAGAIVEVEWLRDHERPPR